MNDLKQKAGVTEPNPHQLKPGFPGFNAKDMATLDYEMDGSQLPVNTLTTLGTGINRWNYLFFDPQKNCVEPFARIGENTVLPIRDTHESECLPIYKSQGQLGP